MSSRWILIALVLVLAAPAALASKKFGNQVGYDGIHPIPKSEGGGICYIEGPHVHIYAANKLEYRIHGDDHVFVGDPVAYGWDGPRYAYKGPHPIHLDVVVGGEPDTEYCYLEGPHYHDFKPPEGPSFKLVGDAYFYVGDPPRAFLNARPTYVGINTLYKPIVYARPVIEVEAPVGWIGARVELVEPVVVRPTVIVPAPAVHIGIEIGAPAVIVVPHGKYRHKKFKHRY